MSKVVAPLTPEYAEQMKTAPFDLVQPMPVAAPWLVVRKILEGARRPWFYKHPAKDLSMLERLEEVFPSVAVADIGRESAGPGSYITGGSMRPKAYGTPSSWAAGKEGATVIIEEAGHGSPPSPLTRWQHLGTPESTYAHEAGHLVAGNPEAWVKPRIYYSEPLGMAVNEGFAEGFGHGLLNMFGKKSQATYWPGPYGFISAPPRIQEPYIKAGELGVDVGRALRSGGTPNQMEAIEELMRLIEYYR